MWKKIGIKNQNNLSSEMCNDSTGGTVFKRIRPLDETSFGQRESSYSKNSANSSLKKGPGRLAGNYVAVRGTRTPKNLSNLQQSSSNQNIPMLLITSPNANKVLESNVSLEGISPKYFPTKPKQRSSIKIRQTYSPQANHPFDAQLQSFTEEVTEPNCANEDLNRYISILKAKLATSQKLNKQYKSQLNNLKSYVASTRRQVQKQLGGYRAALRNLVELVDKSIHQRKTGLDAILVKNPNPVVPDYGYVVNVIPPKKEVNFNRDVENVMMKIDDLKNDVHNSTAFKQEIFNRIDCNLKRIENMKKQRGGQVNKKR